MHDFEETQRSLAPYLRNRGKLASDSIWKRDAEEMVPLAEGSFLLCGPCPASSHRPSQVSALMDARPHSME